MVGGRHVAMIGGKHVQLTNTVDGKIEMTYQGEQLARALLDKD